MTIKTAFIFDPVGVDLEGLTGGLDGEVYSAISSMLQVLELTPREKHIFDVVYKEEGPGVDFHKGHYDLIVLDYGGLAMWGASGTASFNVSEVCYYAKEHPGTLLIIWTDHTANIYRYALNEDFSDIDNIVCRYAEGKTWDDLDGSDDYKEKFRAWFTSEVNSVVQNRID